MLFFPLGYQAQAYEVIYTELQNVVKLSLTAECGTCLPHVLVWIYTV